LDVTGHASYGLDRVADYFILEHELVMNPKGISDCDTCEVELGERERLDALDHRLSTRRSCGSRKLVAVVCEQRKLLSVGHHNRVVLDSRTEVDVAEE
jgi:hypothetical protein